MLSIDDIRREAARTQRVIAEASGWIEVDPKMYAEALDAAGKLGHAEGQAMGWQWRAEAAEAELVRIKGTK